MPEKTLKRLIDILCAERGEKPPHNLTESGEKNYFRALCNVRPPEPVSEEFLRLQDEYLTERTKERGIVDVESIHFDHGMAIWQGDITRLAADGIVNACNCALLGCFQPLHGCIDNVIHSNAGVQVRLDCNEMMRGGQEPNGKVRVTKGYNLPCRYIFHTVGPQIWGGVKEQDRIDLRNCYLSCLNKADEMNFHSLAFCCLSTGVYSFPKEEACHIAVGTVKEWLKSRFEGGRVEMNVIFDVYSDEDRRIYERELSRQN
jgi:O-acetyl-ADP-ribose deacetylase (regulator of RNase III)